MSAVPPEGGVLPVDKPVGPTSHDVVARARKALGTKKVGHTGTLDPFASGLLLLCVGPATRLSEYLTGMDKEYVATARLGVRTDTDDREGEPVGGSDAWRGLDGDAVREALAGFVGEISQQPPVYSAKKVKGEAAHRMARRGEAPELEPVEVTVREIERLHAELPDVRFRVRCSSGTYIRAIARDLGEALGVGAHLTALRRTRVGPFGVEEAVAGDALSAEACADAWIAPADALQEMPRVEVDAVGERLLATGQGIAATDETLALEGPVAVVREGALVAVAARRGATLRPRKVFVQP